MGHGVNDLACAGCISPGRCPKRTQYISTYLEYVPKNGGNEYVCLVFDSFYIDEPHGWHFFLVFESPHELLYVRPTSANAWFFWWEATIEGSEENTVHVSRSPLDFPCLLRIINDSSFLCVCVIANPNDKGTAAFRYLELIPDVAFAWDSLTPTMEEDDKPLFLDFAKHVLTWLPEDRVTAHQLGKHHWIASWNKQLDLVQLGPSWKVPQWKIIRLEKKLFHKNQQDCKGLKWDLVAKEAENKMSCP